jgi:hypothetical protein
MLKFDAENFLAKRGIEYITHGVNVKKNEINISCPFCNSEGNPDPSYHLGIQRETGYWSCWRNRRHRGRSLHRVFMKLLRISYDEVCKILGEQTSWLQEGAFDKLAANPYAMFEQNYIEEQLTKGLDWPEDFKQFKGYSSSKRFLDYLISRGYHKNHIDELIDRYSFHYCISGRWQDRVLLPIKIDYRLVTWTSRSILKNTSLRYMSLSEKDGALMSIKDTVFNFDELSDSEGSVLFICEGPFDAIKVDFYGADLGGRATCLFSKNLRESQAILINEIVRSAGFNRVVVLLDTAEVDTAMLVQSQLSFIRVPIDIGTYDAKDPGDLTSSQVYKLVEKHKL